MRLLGTVLLFVGAASFAMAQPAVPEIGAGAAMNAVTLLSGALLVMRSRRKRQ